MMKKDNDQLARESIKNDIGCNILVSAGAGSGKTRQLVERMTAAVGACVDISRLCAITFTKAAAREFYMRFQTKLSQLAVNEPDSVKAERYRKALDNIDLCFMGTIDSFSELLLREHPTDAGLPSDFTVKEEAEMGDVYGIALSQIAKGDGRYSAELFRKYLLFAAVNKDPDKVFKVACKKYSQLRHTKMIHTEYSGDIEKDLEEEKRQLIQLLQRIIDHPEVAYTSGKIGPKNIKKLETIITVLEEIKCPWESIFSSITDILNKAEKYLITCTPDAMCCELSHLFIESGNPKNAYRLIFEKSDFVGKLKEYKYSATIDFIEAAIKEISDVNVSNGRLSFYDAKMCLRDMLKKDAANGGRLIRHISERHSYFLIDEFQDTDPVQSEIFFYLAAKEPDPDWTKCVPRDGSLFVVGDPKQSIYRFRGADTSAFTAVKELFERSGGRLLGLTRNFRTVPKLKEKFNELFTKLLPEDTKDQSRFEEIPIDADEERNDDIFSGMYKYHTDEESDVDDVIRLIKGLVGDKNKFVIDRDSKEKRNISYKDFMIIVPYKTNINKFMHAMKEAGIPFSAEGSNLLGKCPVLVALYQAVTALAHPDESIAVFTAINGGCFGIGEYELSCAKPVFSLHSFNPTGDERIDKAFAALDELYKKKDAYAPSVLCSIIIKELGLLEKLPADNLESLFFALDLLRDAETKGEISSLNDAADKLKEMIYTKKHERTLRFEGAGDLVRIANLHKVKGLEENIVILADGLKSEHDPEQRVERTEDGYNSYIFNCSEKGAYIHTDLYGDKNAEEKQALIAESERLLYVAATRARSALIVADAEGTNKPNRWRFLAENTDEVIDYPDTDTVSVKHEIKASDIAKKAAEPFKDSPSLEKSYRIVLPSKIKAETKASKDTGADDTPTPKRREGTDPRFTGILVHRLMERIVSAPTLPEKEDVVSAVIYELDGNDEYKAILNGVYDKLKSGGFAQKNGMPDDIIAELKDAENIGCEVPFCYKAQSDNGYELVDGVIDLIYKKNGKWFIIDYKTNYETAALDDKYAAQLSAYKAAFNKLTGETAESYIYHIDV
ncbi:UvrD-helicase domain-containing protein [Ruminococcus sp. NK3A76]|uniref:UvrD-helicase domain-containing protein n=1 Tax=Ruminococcus sp. NK3A76 TaxID=877411 RepID=UPI0009FCA9C8|nr:UvrD-helicase domain-containing protein [Ruminococcus sp. NK3A76]